MDNNKYNKDYDPDYDYDCDYDCDDCDEEYDLVTTKCITFKKATIYNFITGEEYSITIDLNKLNTQKITNIFEEILTNFNYKPKLKKNWLNTIVESFEKNRIKNKTLF